MRNIILAAAVFVFTSITGSLVHAANSTEKVQTVSIKVTISGYEPDKIEVKSGVPIQLEVTRVTDSTCATEIRIPSLKVDRALALGKTEVISLGALKKGTYKFGCAMDMMIFGNIIVQ